MKREYTTHRFKVKYSCGIDYRGTFFEYVGKSRIDGFPIYSCEVENGAATDWGFYFQDFVFCGRPGYTPKLGDFEYMPSQDSILTPPGDDLVPVQPMPAPTGHLFLFDYVYEESLDARLLLLL